MVSYICTKNLIKLIIHYFHDELPFCGFSEGLEYGALQIGRSLSDIKSHSEVGDVSASLVMPTLTTTYHDVKRLLV